MLRLHHVTVHHTCMPTGFTNFNTSISTNPQLLTSMTLILRSWYLKTIIRNQTSDSIQCTSMKVFILSLKENFHVVLKDYQNNISEVLEQKLYNSKDISEAHRVF